MKFIFPSLFLFAVQMAFGQKIHEVKTDILMPMVSGVHVGYEFIPEKRWGLELEARYRWKVPGYQSGTCSRCDQPLVFSDNNVLTINLSAKFYLPKNASGSGVFAGLYAREDLLLSSPDPTFGYDHIPEYYLPIREAQPLTRYLRSGIGILAGYKFIAWKRLVLEASMGMDWDYRWIFANQRNGFDWSGIPSLKAGYRL